MVEVICDHYTLKKVHGMNLRSLMPLVALSCGKMDKGNFIPIPCATNSNLERFLEHIDVLCEVAPTICSTESFLSNTCLKLSEDFDVNKILECVNEEINCLMRIKLEPAD